jgi:hypothetical protein
MSRLPAPTLQTLQLALTAAEAAIHAAEKAMRIQPKSSASCAPRWELEAATKRKQQIQRLLELRGTSCPQ